MTGDLSWAAKFLGGERQIPDVIAEVILSRVGHLFIWVMKFDV